MRVPTGSDEIRKYNILWDVTIRDNVWLGKNYPFSKSICKHDNIGQKNVNIIQTAKTYFIYISIR